MNERIPSQCERAKRIGVLHGRLYCDLLVPSHVLEKSVGVARPKGDPTGEQRLRTTWVEARGPLECIFGCLPVVPKLFDAEIVVRVPVVSVRAGGQRRRLERLRAATTNRAPKERGNEQDVRA